MNNIHQTNSMTINDELKTLGFTISKLDDGFVIKGLGEEYFTDNLQTAVHTARFLKSESQATPEPLP